MSLLFIVGKHLFDVDNFIFMMYTFNVVCKFSVSIHTYTTIMNGLDCSWMVNVSMHIFRAMCMSTTFLNIRSQMEWEYPLNLSILIRGGKETNKDSLSNGEWSGKSSNWKSGTQAGFWIVCYRRVVSVWPRLKSLETGHHRGWESRVQSGVRRVRRMFLESSCLGLQL